MFAAEGQSIFLRRCVMHYVMITEGGRETEIGTERARRDEAASAAGEREQRARTERETRGSPQRKTERGLQTEASY